MGIVKSIVEKLKIKEIFGLVFIAAVILTFMPNSLAKTMQLERFRDTYQPYISLCILIIGAYYILCAIGYVWKLLLRKLISSKKVALKYMKTSMSPDEMGLLVEAFYDREYKRFRSSGKIHFEDGRKTPLEQKSIIYLASTLGDMLSGFSYNLQPYALDFLNKNLKEGNIVIENSSIKYKLQ